MANAAACLFGTYMTHDSITTPSNRDSSLPPAQYRKHGTTTDSEFGRRDKDEDDVSAKEVKVTSIVDAHNRIFLKVLRRRSLSFFEGRPVYPGCRWLASS